MEKIAENWKKENSRSVSSIFSQITTAKVVIIAVGLLILLAMSKGNSDPRYTYVIYGALIVIILVLYFKPMKEKKLLPEYIIKRIAKEELEKKRREGVEIAHDSRISPTLQCHLRYENDFITGSSGPVGWDVGFVELVHGTKYKKEGVISLHPYEGIVTGFKLMPLGYSGRESHDKDIIPVGVMQGTMKTTDYGPPTGSNQSGQQ